jgi:ribosome maturation factor RimP
MGSDSSPRLRGLIEPAVRMLGYDLVAIEQFSQGGGQTLRIYIDKEGGVTLDDCERVSHQVSGVLDVEDAIEGRYVLEVSSPGLDRPLSAAKDFERFSGRQVKLRTYAPVDGQRNFKGLLQGVVDGRVLIEVDGRRISLPLDGIEKARLIPEV